MKLHAGITMNKSILFYQPLLPITKSHRRTNHCLQCLLFQTYAQNCYLIDNLFYFLSVGSVYNCMRRKKVFPSSCYCNPSSLLRSVQRLCFLSNDLYLKNASKDPFFIKKIFSYRSSDHSPTIYSCYANILMFTDHENNQFVKK